MFDIKKVKRDFPIFKNNPGLVYLDTAASSQKPEAVIKAVSDFYRKYNSNVHRGIYDLSQKATDLYEGAREKTAAFINGDSSEIIFTGNTSEAINLVAFGYARKFLKRGDIIVLSEMEHHSNLVPWLRLQKEVGIKLFFMPVTSDYQLDYKSVLKVDVSRIKLVTFTHASNVLGTINPVREIISFLKKNGVKAKILIDAAQSVPHFPVDVKELGCDFLAFSSYKMLGPSGVGVLWAKSEILEEMDPLFVGGHMIKTVTKAEATWSPVPGKFETGTGRLEGVVGLGAAIDYLNKLGMKNVFEYEEELVSYGLERLLKVKGLELYGSKKSQRRLAVFAFNLKNIHPHDVAEILNRYQICTRTGHHCAQVLLSSLGLQSTVRASAYIYNTKEDIHKLAEGLEETSKIFGI